jgi:hypothetical protein
MTDENRGDQFRADMATLQVKTSGKASSERAGGIIGVVLMVASIVVGVGSFVNAGNQTNALDQNELIILGFVCVSAAIIGAAMWLRYTLVRFWRFWMLRSLYEGQAHLDEVVTAIRDRS